MPFLEFFDETLDINSTDNYDLSVQLSPEGLAFCILDSIRNKYILIRSFEPDDNKYFSADTIRDIIKKDDFLGRKFRKTRIVMPVQKSTVVPMALYDNDRKEDYFTLNYIKEYNETILSNKINDPESYVLFACRESLLEAAKDHFGEAEPFHQLKTLFLHASSERKRQSGQYIHVHVEREFFNLLIFNQNNLILCNSFSYKNSSDILYYVMNAFKQLELKNEETIHLTGLTQKHDELSTGFLTYVRNVSYPVPTGNFTFSYVFNEIELHRYINLLTLVNCG